LDDGGKADRFTLLGAVAASTAWYIPVGCSQDSRRRLLVAGSFGNSLGHDGHAGRQAGL